MQFDLPQRAILGPEAPQYRYDGAAWSAAPSYLTAGTIASASSVNSFRRKLVQFENGVKRNFRICEDMQPVEAGPPTSWGFRTTIIDHPPIGEKKHFPELTNQEANPDNRPHGRRYIPHGHCEDVHSSSYRRSRLKDEGKNGSTFFQLDSKQNLGAGTDRRNGIRVAAPGDKCYQAAEYSADFHKRGCTRAVVNFGDNYKDPNSTFVPMKQHNSPKTKNRLSWKQEIEKTERSRDILDVKCLDNWSAATPLLSPKFHPAGHRVI